jgi:hypothetical protein
MLVPLTQETWKFVMSLIYAVTRVSDPISVMDKLVSMSIRDPVSSFTRTDRIAQLEEALQSDEDLSRLGGVPRHTNGVLREMLAELSRRIASEEDRQVMTPDTDAKLPGLVATRIGFILTPLIEFGNEHEAGKKLSDGLSSYWTPNTRFRELSDHLASIRYALKSNIVLSRLAGDVFAEEVVRSYLREAAVLVQAKLSDG